MIMANNELVIKNNELQIADVYDEFMSTVFNFLYWKLRDFHNAEDVTSLVFKKINRLLPSFDINISALSTWIQMITNSVLIDYVRKNKIHRDNYMAVSDFTNAEGENYFEFVSTEKTDVVENQELKDRLVIAFRKLKPSYRKIATLYFIREYKYKEISELLDIKLGTVKAMISRCREMLRNELNDLYSTAKKQVVSQ